MGSSWAISNDYIVLPNGTFRTLPTTYKTTTTAVPCPSHPPHPMAFKWAAWIPSNPQLGWMEEKMSICASTPYISMYILRIDGCSLVWMQLERSRSRSRRSRGRDGQADHIMHMWRMRVATYRHVGVPYLIYRQVVCFMCLPGLVTSYSRHRLSVRHRRWHIRPGRSGLCCSADGSTRVSPIGKYLPYTVHRTAGFFCVQSRMYAKYYTLDTPRAHGQAGTFK